jgi:hypothetical protein
MRTRFCPTLRHDKFLHVGHACMLLITRRWAFEVEADFFHLLGFVYEFPQDLDDAIGAAPHKPAYVAGHRFMDQLNAETMTQIQLLTQWVPAPTITTMLCPEARPVVRPQSTKWCDQVMGTTDIWRGDPITAVYKPHQSVEVHLAPLLTHPDVGVIDTDAASGRFRLDHQVRYFNSQWHLLAAIMLFTKEIYQFENVIDGLEIRPSGAIWRESAWEKAHNDTAGNSDRHNREAVHTWLGIHTP